MGTTVLQRVKAVRTCLMQNGQDRGASTICPPLLVGEGLGVRFLLSVFTKPTPHPLPFPYKGKGAFPPLHHRGICFLGVRRYCYWYCFGYRDSSLHFVLLRMTESYKYVILRALARRISKAFFPLFFLINLLTQYVTKCKDEF